jgi:hypothetical protein
VIAFDNNRPFSVISHILSLCKFYVVFYLNSIHLLLFTIKAQTICVNLWRYCLKHPLLK